MTETKTNPKEENVVEETSTQDTSKEPTEVAEQKKQEAKVEEKKEEVKEEVEEEKKPAAKSKTPEEELLEKHNQMVQFVINTMGNVENDLKRIKLVLNQLAKFDPKDPKSLEATKDAEKAMWTTDLQSYEEDDVQVVEGKFDGYFMIGADQKKYPVPLNYSSKTKLVPGDVLKLKILGDGKFVYKLIRPIERKHIRATLSKTDDNKFIAVDDQGKNFFLNQAAVTFFKGKPGDELYIVTNEKGEGSFAAIEAIIKK